MDPSGFIEPVIAIIEPMARSTSRVGYILSTSSIFEKLEHSSSSTITFKCSRILSNSSILFSSFSFLCSTVFLPLLFSLPLPFLSQRSFRHGLVNNCPLLLPRIFWIRVGHIVSTGGRPLPLPLHLGSGSF